jgi:4-alpha-glucanotransferase
MSESRINPKEKMVGVLVPVFALRREGDLGIGDTLAMREALDFCGRNNLAVLQVLPINETGGDNSPYNALSSLALDPVLLDVSPEAVPGLTADSYSVHVTPAVVQSVDGSSVEYSKVKPLKLRLLRAAYDNFRQSEIAAGSKSAEEFRDFKAQHATWLQPYSLFRLLVDEYQGNARWPYWRAQHQLLSTAEKWFDELSDEAIKQTRDFYAFVQWVAFRQWDGVRAHADRLGIALMGDLPFGISRYSADVWAERQLFDLAWSGGAPPEPYFQDSEFVVKWGQNWGIPLYKWEAHRQEDFGWWRKRVGLITQVFHYFRIDHVLGFFRIYAFPWIPERNDEFVKLNRGQAVEKTGGLLPQFIPRNDYPKELGEKNSREGEALLVMIQEAAGESGVVAEDLGTVPWYVRPMLRQLGIPGFAIPIFERDEKTKEFKPKEELHELILSNYATHDLAPLVCFYEELVRRWHVPDGHEAWLDVQRLMRFLGLDDVNPPTQFTPQLHEAFMKALLETKCWLAMFMITDILGTSERYNEPGSASKSNWSRRMDCSLVECEKSPHYAEKIRLLSELVKKTGRLPRVPSMGTIPSNK